MVTLSPKAREIAERFKEFCRRLGGRIEEGNPIMSEASKTYICLLPRRMPAELSVLRERDGSFSVKMRVGPGYFTLDGLDEVVYHVERVSSVAERLINPRIYEEGRVEQWAFWDKAAGTNSATELWLSVHASGKHVLISLL